MHDTVSHWSKQGANYFEYTQDWGWLGAAKLSSNLSLSQRHSEALENVLHLFGDFFCDFFLCFFFF